MHEEGSISIWFFIGVSLLVNGLLITGAGIYEYSHPPAIPVVLYKVHANVWWGGVLFLIGAMYCYFYAPNRQKA